MPLSRDALLLRIFIGEDDKAGHTPLYEAIVLHTAKILRLSQDLPLVIEIVDNEDKIGKFVAAIEPIMGSALITTEKVKVIRYGDGGPCGGA